MATTCRASTTSACRRTAPATSCDLLGKADLVERARVIVEKPFGTDLASAAQLNPTLHTTFAEEPDLPHRPLPRQGSGAQHPGASASPTVCSNRSGTATTSTTCRSTCPRPCRSGARHPFYENHRRLPRHGGDAPVPDARVHGDGAARRATRRRRSAKRRARCSGRCNPFHPGRRRAGPVRRLPRRARGHARLRHRDLRGAPLHGRQHAVERRAVLSPHREAPGRNRAHHLDRVPITADRACSRPDPAWVHRGPTTSPSISATRRGCRCRSTGSGPAPACTSTKESLQFELHDAGEHGRLLEAY